MGSLPSPLPPLSPEPKFSLQLSQPLPCCHGYNMLLSTRQRLLILASLTIGSSDCHFANALSFGISGPKDWLKNQKKKTASFLLAPIMASKERLHSAQAIISNSDSITDLQEVRNLVMVAARDCIPPDSGSLVALQTMTGVEVCTFRLILSNAASLLEKEDPAKLKADAALNDLISSFISLEKLLSAAVSGATSKREDVADACTQTLSTLDIFDRSIRDCLGIA